MKKTSSRTFQQGEIIGDNAGCMDGVANECVYGVFLVSGHVINRQGIVQTTRIMKDISQRAKIKYLLLQIRF